MRKDGTKLTLMNDPEDPKRNKRRRPDRRSLTHKTIDGLFWASFGAISHVVLQLGVVAVLARVLAPKDFGMVAAAGTLIGLAAILVDLGVGPAIVQRRQLTANHINTGFTMSVAMGLIIGLVFVLAAPVIAHLYRMPELTNVLRVLSLVFPITSFGIVAQSLLSRDMRFQRLSIRNILSYIFGYGLVSVTLALLGFGVWSLVLGQLVQTSLQAFQTILIAGQHLRFGWNKQARRDLMSYGVGFTLARFGNYVANQGDNVIVGRMLGPTALGFYSRAYQFIALPANLFGSVTNTVLFPAMSAVQHDQEKLERAYRQSLAMIAMVTLPVSGLLFVAAPEAVEVLLGPKWTAVVPPFQVLVLSLIFRTSYKMSDSLARASAATMNRAWRQWFYAASVIGGAFVGIHYGITGVAVGVSIAIVLNFLLMLQLSMVLSGVSAQTLLGIHVRHFVVALFTTLAAYAAITLARSAGIPEFGRLVTASAAAGATWLLIAALVPKLVGEELTFLIGMIKSRLALRRQNAKPHGSTV
jgi:O-antigen/teichoic acid export membrane protein